MHKKIDIQFISAQIVWENVAEMDDVLTKVSVWKSWENVSI